MTEQEKLSLIIDLISRQQKALDENNQRFDSVIKQMPFDHLQQHDLLRLHLAHIPGPKDHGDDHEFTQSLKKHVNTIIDVVVKAVGMAIVAILSLGLVAWVIQTSGVHMPTKYYPQETRQSGN